MRYSTYKIASHVLLVRNVKKLIVSKIRLLPSLSMRLSGTGCAFLPISGNIHMLQARIRC